MKVKLWECKDLRTAKKNLWWACKLKKVVGGWIGFESWNDYKIWKNQK